MSDVDFIEMRVRGSVPISLHLMLFVATAWQKPLLGHAQLDFLAILVSTGVEVPIPPDGDDAIVSELEKEGVDGVGDIMQPFFGCIYADKRYWPVSRINTGSNNTSFM